MVRVLSCHASYRCQRRGRCCSSGWPIPVEADRLARMRAALATGHLRTARAAGAHAPLVGDDDSEGSAAVLGVHESRCVFFEVDEPRRCRVHDALGHDALPLACRQFPRVSVHDPRGVSVVLSHYCPTAASLLDIDEDIRIVTDAPAFPALGEYVGLDATTSLPPLLRPGMLMDWDAWWDLERRAVQWLSRRDGPAGPRLAALGPIVEDIRRWSPRDGSLLERVAATFDDARPASASAPWTAATHTATAARVWATIPEAWRPPPQPSAAAPREAALGRFLASHAFANWTVHLGGDLRTWLASVEAAYALVQTGLDIATTDLILRHLADPKALTATWQAGSPIDR